MNTYPRLKQILYRKSVKSISNWKEGTTLKMASYLVVIAYALKDQTGKRGKNDLL